jgi:hypothetical protein
MNLINRDDALAVAMHSKDPVEGIKHLPAVDAVEVKHGRWVNRSKNQGWKDEEIGTVGMIDGEPLGSCYCSECGEWLVTSDEYPVKGNFCPNCGARMDGE